MSRQSDASRVSGAQSSSSVYDHVGTCAEMQHQRSQHQHQTRGQVRDRERGYGSVRDNQRNNRRTGSQRDLNSSSADPSGRAITPDLRDDIAARRRSLKAARNAKSVDEVAHTRSYRDRSGQQVFGPSPHGSGRHPTRLRSKSTDQLHRSEGMTLFSIYS